METLSQGSNYDYASGFVRPAFIEEQEQQQQLLCFKIMKTGTENSKAYVDVGLSWAKQERSLISETKRYYLSKDEDGYWIDAENLIE